MAHRDGLPRFSARRGGCGDAGHRKARATPSETLGKAPFRSHARPLGGRRQVLTMGHIARNFPPTREAAHAISMGHYQRSLVLCRGIAPSLALRHCAHVNAALPKDDEPEKNHQNDRHDVRKQYHD